MLAKALQNVAIIPTTWNLNNSIYFLHVPFERNKPDYSQTYAFLSQSSDHNFLSRNKFPTSSIIKILVILQGPVQVLHL